MTSPDGVIPFEKPLCSPEVDFSKPLNTSNLNGKTIVITGGASGLGEGYFKAWAKHGATIIIGDINEARGNALTEKLRSTTGNKNLHFLKLNVTEWQSQAAFFREACNLSPHGGIDCVIANAGISSGPETEGFENPPNYYDQKDPPPPKLTLLDVNFTGVIYTTTLAISYLSRNPGSQKCSVDLSSSPRDRHLILIASIAGLSGVIHQPLYAATKHAVVGLFRTLRMTMAITHGIRVNMLCPYFVVTPILGVAGAVVMAGAGVGEVDDVVDTATRLVTDQSIIGRALAIGPKVSMSDAKAVGFQVDNRDAGSKQAAWDVHAHDFEQTDVFTRRVIALTNLIHDQRGWSGLLGDLGRALTSPVKRIFGY